MNRGGAEMRTLEVLKFLQKDDDVEQHFCVLSGLPGVLDNDIREVGGHLHYIPLNASFAINFMRLLRREKFDVVHSHVQNSSGLILAIAFITKIKKRIAHFRNTNSDHHLTFMKKCQYGVMRFLIDKFATEILAVCEGAMEEGWRTTWRKDDRCHVVYNGFESGLYKVKEHINAVFSEFHIKPECRLVFHIGRMDPVKNHRYIAEIFTILAKRNPNLHLLLVGLGGNAIEKELISYFARQNLLERVTFAGVREDVPRLLSAASLMIFPSLWEGLPGAVIEARIAGVPVVASNLPGVREIASILGDITVVNLEAGIEEWARACMRALSNPCRNEPDISGTPFDIAVCSHKFKKIWTANTCE
ncbi:MAG: glycosyltransferase [Clostridia bacterium]